MKGAFVTGTDTDVGKTWVSAWLVRSWQAAYWKPIQTGTAETWDVDVIRVAAPGATLFESRYALSAPLSPHEAAARAGVAIGLADFALPETPHPLVVEGAGGVLVPLNSDSFMVDLMAQLALPVIVVARSGLGTINHTLLALEALRKRGVEPAGVILNGSPNPANRSAIEHFGRIAVVAELPRLPDLDALHSFPPLAWRPEGHDDR